MRSFGRAGTATLFPRPVPGATPRLAVGPRGDIAVLRVRGGRAEVRRLTADGLPLAGFSAAPLRAAREADLAFDRSGRLLVLADTRRLVALDERGKRVPPIGGDALTVPAR